MNTTESTSQVIQNFLQCLTQRDLGNIVNLFSDDIDWNIPGDKAKAPWLGERYSRSEIKNFYELLWKNTEPLSATIYHIFVDNQDVVISGEFSTKMLQTGNVVNSLFFIQLKVQEGLIVKYRLLEDSYAVSKALTSSLG